MFIYMSIWYKHHCRETGKTLILPNFAEYSTLLALMARRQAACDMVTLPA